MCARSARRTPAATTARAGQRRSAQQARERGDEQREVGREPDRALLGEDGDRDRVRRGLRALDRTSARGGGTDAANEPEPQPATGRVAAQAQAAVDQVVATRGGLVERLGGAEVDPQRAGKATTSTAASRPRRRSARPRASRQRSRASTARPTSSAAKLDCESVSSRPPHRTASTAAARRVSRRRRPQQHAGERDHHQRQEAPVDVRIEEQRVDAEVLLDLVRGDHLRVQQQLARLVLPEADRVKASASPSSTRRPARNRCSVHSRSRRRRTGARTGRRRRRPARAPWRCRPSTSDCSA